MQKCVYTCFANKGTKNLNDILQNVLHLNAFLPLLSLCSFSA